MTPDGKKPRSKLASFALAAAMTLGLAPGVVASAAVDPVPVQGQQAPAPKPFEKLDGTRAVRYHVPRLRRRKRRRGLGALSEGMRTAFRFKFKNRFLRRSMLKAAMAGRGLRAELHRTPRNLRYDGTKIVSTTVRAILGQYKKAWFERRRQAWVDARVLAAADQSLTYQHTEET